jgi:hypothetical protein
MKKGTQPFFAMGRTALMPGLANKGCVPFFAWRRAA